MNSITTLISLLFASRTQAHIFHLQTTSYAAHIALQAYYEGIIPLIDAFVESYQGKYGIISGYTLASSVKERSSTQEMVDYFNQLADMIEKSGEEIPQDAFLTNQIDEMVALVRSTTYKLRFLQ
jgi:hypothetical protein